MTTPQDAPKKTPSGLAWCIGIILVCLLIGALDGDDDSSSSSDTSSSSGFSSGGSSSGGSSSSSERDESGYLSAVRSEVGATILSQSSDSQLLSWGNRVCDLDESGGTIDYENLAASVAAEDPDPATRLAVLRALADVTTIARSTLCP